MCLSETGQLTLPNNSVINAERRWLWELKAPDQLEIYYDEQPARLYHLVVLANVDGIWRGTASHLCEPDTYAGMYKFGDGEFQIDQTVTGPRKDYSISSIYSM